MNLTRYVPLWISYINSTLMIPLQSILSFVLSLLISISCKLLLSYAKTMTSLIPAPFCCQYSSYTSCPARSLRGTLDQGRGPLPLQRGRSREDRGRPAVPARAPQGTSSPRARAAAAPAAPLPRGGGHSPRVRASRAGAERKGRGGGVRVRVRVRVCLSVCLGDVRGGDDAPSLRTLLSCPPRS